MATLESLIARVQALIPVTAGTVVFGSAELAEAVRMALIWHSRFKPAPMFTVIEADGSGFYALPADCIRVNSVEYPYPGTPPTYSNQWSLHMGTRGSPELFFMLPRPGERFGLYYRGFWTVESLPEFDEQPLAFLAAAWIAIYEASRMAEVVGTTISAEIVDYRGLVNQWLNIKDHCLRLYAQSQGLSADAVQSGQPPPAWGFSYVNTPAKFERWFW